MHNDTKGIRPTAGGREGTSEGLDFSLEIMIRGKWPDRPTDRPTKWVRKVLVMSIFLFSTQRAGTAEEGGDRENRYECSSGPGGGRKSAAASLIVAMYEVSSSSPLRTAEGRAAVLTIYNVAFSLVPQVLHQSQTTLPSTYYCIE